MQVTHGNCHRENSAFLRAKQISRALRIKLTVAVLPSLFARFLDRSAEYSRKTDAVNIQGRWCYPITRTLKTEKKISASLSNIVYYQNRDTSQVDMMLLTGKDNNSFLVAGYDYEPIKDGEISVPTRIEIYTANSDGIAQRQLFRIDISATSQK